MKYIIVFFLLLSCNAIAYAQKKMPLSTQAAEWQDKLEQAQQNMGCDSIIFFAKQAGSCYKKLNNWEKYIAMEEAAARCSYDQKNWEKAGLQYDTVLVNSKKYLSKLHLTTAQITHTRGLIHYYLGEFNDALLCFNEALNTTKILYGEKHELVGNYFASVGLANYKKSFFNQAIGAFDKSLAIRRKLYGEKHEKVAEIYTYLGDAYNQQGFYDKSLEFSQKGLATQKELFGENHLSVAASYFSMALAYKSKGYYDKSLEYALSALQIRKQLSGENTLEVAATYRLIGDIHVDKVLYDKALEYFDKFLTIEKNLVGERHPDIAKAYSNIGRIFRAKQQNENALPYFQKALELQEEFLGWQHLDVADTYNDLGDVHLEQKDYKQALTYYTLAVELQEGIKKQEDEALNKNNKQKKKYKGTERTNHLVSFSYNKIGKLYLLTKEFDKALETFEANLKIQHEIWGEKHPDIAATYNNLADVYFLQGQHEKSLEIYQKSLVANIVTFKETAPKENPVWAAVQNNFFQYTHLLYALQQKFATYVALYQQTKNKEWQKAAYHVLLNIDEFSGIVKRNLTDDNEKMNFLAQVNAIYTSAVPICLQLADKQPNEFTEKAFYFSEKNKATLLLGKLAESKAKSFAGLPDSLLAQEQDLAKQIAQYQSLLLAAEMQDNTAQIPALKTSLFDSKRQYEQLVAKFEKDFPQYHELKYNSKIASIKDVQALLDAQTALIDYVVADTSIYIFTITNKTVDIQVVKRDDSFEKLVTKFRNTIYYQVGMMYVHTAYEIFEKYFPKNLSPKVKHLIIIPDDVLHNVPFDALLTEVYKGETESLDYSDLPYLIQDYDISYHYSATLFLQNEVRQQKEKKEAVKKKVTENYYVAFAPVFSDGRDSNLLLNSERLYYANESALKAEQDNFNQFTVEYPEALVAMKKQEEKALQASHKNNKKHIAHIEQQRAFDRNGKHITPLPQTAVEVESITSHCNKKKLIAKSYLHENAKEEVIKSGELAAYQYIHFATHGLVNKVQPELSGLLLAQNPNSNEDGLLYIGEIYGLQLNAELVTLSACETALGKLSKGEGVVGFTRAFMYAGAKNVLVSLWKVSDASTSEMMIEFYEQLISGRSKAESLKRSKQALIKNKRFNKPYFWSPFVIIGK